MSIDINSALYILGIDDPSEELLTDINWLSDLDDDNAYFEDHKQPALVNRDYGPLNELAKALGIQYEDSTVPVGGW